MHTLTSLYAWLLAGIATADGDQSVSLVTVLVVLGIVALLVFIFGGRWWRGRGG